jgi:prepilin-type N-terminal cleavage/methylation domain-containing protein/prepilin-type processing-associated H-X9-DG protein
MNAYGVLPWLQLTFGAALFVTNSYRLWAFVSSSFLFMAFLFTQFSASWRGLDISCGCFGASETTIGLRSLAIAAAGLFVSLTGAIIELKHLETSSSTKNPSHLLEPATVRSGFSLIELTVALAIIAILAGLILAGIQKIRSIAARADCQTRMRQSGLALHQYHGSNGSFPPGLSLRADHGKYSYLGWGGRILPYVEQDAVWREILQAFASDPAPLSFYGHPPHAALLANPIRAFACPTDARVPGPAMTQTGLLVAHTSYLGVQGRNQYSKDGMLFLDSSVRISDVTDGTTQTLLLGERPPPADFRVGWWYRGWGQSQNGSTEMLLCVQEFNDTRPDCGPPKAWTFRDGSLTKNCPMFHFWSVHQGGANFVFADGSVHFLRYSAEPVMVALSTRAGGESSPSWQ